MIKTWSIRLAAAAAAGLLALAAYAVPAQADSSTSPDSTSGARVIAEPDDVKWP